jgi:hypothetical protein
MPLANNGQTSFWSPDLAQKIFHECGLNLSTSERHGRTSYGGKHYVEYLALVSVKPR